MGLQVPLTRPPAALLTLTWAGRTWRFATETCNIQDRFGVWNHYAGALPSMDVYEEAPLFDVGAPPRQTFDLVVPDDLAQLVNELGHAMDNVEGELALWAHGTALEDRHVTMKGKAVFQKLGRAGQASSIRVEGYDFASATLMYPPESAIIGDSTWSSAAPVRSYDPQWEGQPYPTCYGRAGVMRHNGATRNIPATPAYFVTAQTGALEDRTPFRGIKISDHNPAAPTWTNWVLANLGWSYPALISGNYRATVWGGDGSSEWGYLYFARDALGQIVTLLGKNAWTTLYGGAGIVAGNQYFVTWDGGAKGNRTYDGFITGAGDIIRDALELGDVPVDWRRLGPAMARLNAFKFAGFWDKQQRGWDFVLNEIVPYLPVSAVPGPNGVYLVPWRWDVRPSEIGEGYHFTDGHTCTLQDAPAYEGDDEVISSVSLDYAHTLLKSRYWRRTLWHGGTLTTPRESSAQQLAVAAQQGVSGQHAKQSTMIYRDQTADLFCAWKSQAFSGSRRTVRNVGDGVRKGTMLGRLSPGHPVLLSSSRYSLSNTVAHVRRAGWQGPRAYADCVILSRP